jgi:hypothetical protein
MATASTERKQAFYGEITMKLNTLRTKTATKKLDRGDPTGEVRVVYLSDRHRGSRPLRHIVLHSPAGMAWGYEGSGPADLALSILSDVLGERPTPKQLMYGQFKAQPHYQAFKRTFVAGWEMGYAFEIDADKVIDWLKMRGVSI